jgi:hypothetical protein
METAFSRDALHMIHGTITTSMLSSFYFKLPSKSSVWHSLTALHTQQRLERVRVASRKINIIFISVLSSYRCHCSVRSLVPAPPRKHFLVLWKSREGLSAAYPAPLLQMPLKPPRPLYPLSIFESDPEGLHFSRDKDLSEPIHGGVFLSLRDSVVLSASSGCGYMHSFF